MSKKDRVIGPAMPSGFKMKRYSDSEGSDDNKEKDTTSTASIGPALPPGFKRTHSSDPIEEGETYSKRAKTDNIGPALPPGFVQSPPSDSSDSSVDSDDDVIGPALPSSGENNTQPEFVSAAEQLVLRAEKMRQKLLHPEELTETPKERETWMTELPKSHELVKTNLMPVAKTRLGDGKSEIDHSWTLAPGQKPQQSSAKPEAAPKVMSQRDREMAAAVSELDKKRRSESLLEMHRKKLEKKQKKKEKKEKKEKKKKKKGKDKGKTTEKPERRPFSREDDLNTNVLDDAKKRAMIKKSQVLNTRFGHSASGQFL